MKGIRVDEREYELKALESQAALLTPSGYCPHVHHPRPSHQRQHGSDNTRGENTKARPGHVRAGRSVPISRRCRFRGLVAVPRGLKHFRAHTLSTSVWIAFTSKCEIFGLNLSWCAASVIANCVSWSISMGIQVKQEQLTVYMNWSSG